MTSNKRRHRGKRDVDKMTPFWKDRSGVSPAIFLLTSAVLGGGVLLGGSGGSIGDTFVQLLALPLIVLAAMHWSQRQLLAPDWAALVIIGGIVLLAFVQLIPLPASVWAGLPARDVLLHEMQSVGVNPAWPSISLNPFSTERAFHWTLPAIAMFLSVRWMSQRQHRVLLLLLFVGALLLIIQTAASHSAPQGNALATANNAIAKATFALNQGQTTVLPPPPPSFIGGLFSNRNHFATFLAMTVPLVAAMTLRIWINRTPGAPKTWVPWTSFFALVLIGLIGGMIQTHSRAALILGGIALVGSLGLLRHLQLKPKLVWSVVGCSIVCAVIALQMAGSVTLARLDTSLDTDARWRIHATTLEAARHFGPLGSGLGTFVEAYQQVAPDKDAGPEYINRAHSDYHELWLETGIPGVLLVVGFLAWFAWSSWRVWRDGEQTRGMTLIARAATLSVLMVLLHSYLDYPLRKTAILVMLGTACALMAPSEAPTKRDDLEKRKARA